MEELTGFQRDVLYVVLHEEHPSGQSIRRKMEEHYNENINHGRLYPNLDTLVESGLLNKGKKDERTNEYQITSKGKDKIVSRQIWLNKNIENTRIESDINKMMS